VELKSIEWVISQGVGAVLALIMFLVYRKDVTSALNSWQNQTKILTDLVRDISVTIQVNAEATAKLEQAVSELTRQLPHACPMTQQLENGVEVVIRKEMAQR